MDLILTQPGATQYLSVPCDNIALTATDATRVVFIANDTYVLSAVQAVFSTASTSGTLQVEVLSGTTAPGSGINQLTGTMSLAGTANTVVNGTVIAQPTVITPGMRVGIVIAGTMTNLAGGIVTITFRKI